MDEILNNIILKRMNKKRKIKNENRKK